MGYNKIIVIMIGVVILLLGTLVLQGMNFMSMGNQGAAAQKTVPTTSPLKITATPVSSVGLQTTLVWSSPTSTSFSNCQGTATDKYGFTIPSVWNGSQTGLNAGNNYQATLSVPVQINEVNFKIKCQSTLGAGTFYNAEVKSTISTGSPNFNISIDPPSILSGQVATITYMAPSQATYCAPYAYPSSTGTGDWTGKAIVTGTTTSVAVHPPGLTGYATEYGLSCLINGGNSNRSTAIIIR